MDHESSEILEQLPRKKREQKVLTNFKRDFRGFFYERDFKMWFSEQAKTQSLPVICAVLGDLPSLPMSTFMWLSSRCKFAW